MAGLSDILQYLKQASGNQPDAYSRATRTPIYRANMPSGVDAQYTDKTGPFGGYIEVPPGEIDKDNLRHEEGHSIWDAAGLKQHSEELAKGVDPSITRFLKRDPYYRKDSSSNALAGEGLGWTLSGLGTQDYLKQVYDKITDPTLKVLFMKLVQQLQKK